MRYRRQKSKKSTQKKHVAPSSSKLIAAKCINETEEENCPICLASIDSPAKPNVCQHMFCKSCLVTWSRQKSECPLCRKIFRRSNILYYCEKKHKWLEPKPIKINVNICNMYGKRHKYKIKTNRPLLSLMKEHCYEVGLLLSDARFRFDGQPARARDTPDDLDMEDGDWIDLFESQCSGPDLPVSSRLRSRRGRYYY